MHALAGAPREWRARKVLHRTTTDACASHPTPTGQPFLEVALAKMRAPAHRLGMSANTDRR